LTSLRFADTGQTTCYNASASQACGDLVSFPYQDADFVNIPAARSFTGPTLVGASDYITTDNVTGLVWKTCSEGLSGAACATGTVGSYKLSPDTATPQCASLNAANSGTGYAGRTNWRLPTVSELQTLANYSGVIPTIDALYFPATDASAYYWTSSADVSSATSAWRVYSDGSVSSALKTSSNDVRCVASPPTTFSTHSDNGDGTVTDTNNNLTWQKCADGLSGAACGSGSITGITWQGALQYCKTLSFTGRAWRLPSINELYSLVDVTQQNSSINATYFPGTGATSYWSSSSYSPATSAWVVRFDFGGIYVDAKTPTTDAVRCVATGP